MAKAPRVNPLHLIQHVMDNPTARSVVGSLSQKDLKLLSDALKAGTLKPHLDHLLGHDDPVAQVKAGTGDIAQVMQKLPDSSIKSLSTLWQQKGLICL